MTASLPPLSFAPVALALDDLPVVVEYTAPTPECASSEAFQALLGTEIARSPRLNRDWRFAVRIVRQDGSYEGTLTTQTGVRKVAAAQCDDVTAALAVIITVAELSADEPSRSDETPSGASAPAPAVATEPSPVESAPAAERGREPEDNTHLQWRLGVRGLASTHPTWGFPNLGALGAISLELPWGWRKMMFEVGAGYSMGQASTNSALSPAIGYVIVDTQACLLDLPLEKTELNLLGCLRLAGAAFTATGGNFLIDQNTSSGLAVPSHVATGGAFWGGASARLRWQTRIRLFFEANVDAMSGTVSEGEDNSLLWVSMGLGAGFEI